MRTLLALILSVLLPGKGKRRAAPGVETTIELRAIDIREPIYGMTARAVMAELRGEDHALVRPFVVEHFRVQEARQREAEQRREAAAMEASA